MLSVHIKTATHFHFQVQINKENTMQKLHKRKFLIKNTINSEPQEFRINGVFPIPPCAEICIFALSEHLFPDMRQALKGFV